MTITVDELIDRAEIGERLAVYLQSQDQEMWDLFDTVFTETATIEIPGQRLPWREMKALLQGFNSTRVSGQHLVTNTLFSFEGDRATTLSEMQAYTLQSTDEPGRYTKSISASLYEDSWLKTDAGWRIDRRIMRLKRLENETVEVGAESAATFAKSGDDLDFAFGTSA